MKFSNFLNFPDHVLPMLFCRFVYNRLLNNCVVCSQILGKGNIIQLLNYKFYLQNYDLYPKISNFYRNLQLF
jgi:hypothetical protein